MKKIVCILLAALTLMSVLPMAMAEEGGEEGAVQSPYYYDVYSTDFYYDAAIYLYDHDIMQGVSSGNGTTKGQFGGNQILKRAQIVVMLWRMDGSPEVYGINFPFTDCPSNKYYYKAVKWAYKNNIVSGTSATTFSPNDNLSHQQALAILYRYMCFCGYITDSSYYVDLFNSSNITYKSEFSSYAKASAGWAYSVGILTDKNIHPKSNCSRGSAANYVYRIYKKYQKKYGLVVINTKNMAYVTTAGAAMQTVFKHYNASNTLLKSDITKSQFATAMTNAFSSAKRLDICYLYCASHGGKNGLSLFTEDSNCILTPTYLRTQINRFKGTFVVFVSGCHTGTYIEGEGILEEDETEDQFDAEEFVAILTDQVESAEGNATALKVLCSSRKDEVSYTTSRYATKYWCLGSGYDLVNDQFGALMADSNSDHRVSLQELNAYARAQVLSYIPTQHMVCSPANDSFIIFESTW